MTDRASENRMRGVAYDYDGAPIEFRDGEPEQFFSKIFYEHLPPAHQCGAATIKRKPNALELGAAIRRFGLTGDK